jgi:hypothetical protein
MSYEPSQEEFGTDNKKAAELNKLEYLQSYKHMTMTRRDALTLPDPLKNTRNPHSLPPILRQLPTLTIIPGTKIYCQLLHPQERQQSRDSVE